MKERLRRETGVDVRSVSRSTRRKHGAAVEGRRRAARHQRTQRGCQQRAAQLGDVSRLPRLDGTAEPARCSSRRS